MNVDQKLYFVFIEYGLSNTMCVKRKKIKDHKKSYKIYKGKTYAIFWKFLFKSQDNSKYRFFLKNNPF